MSKKKKMKALTNHREARLRLWIQEETSMYFYAFADWPDWAKKNFLAYNKGGHAGRHHLLVFWLFNGLSSAFCRAWISIVAVDHRNFAVVRTENLREVRDTLRAFEADAFYGENQRIFDMELKKPIHPEERQEAHAIRAIYDLGRAKKNVENSLAELLRMEKKRRK